MSFVTMYERVYAFGVLLAASDNPYWWDSSVSNSHVFYINFWLIGHFNFYFVPSGHILLLANKLFKEILYLL